MTPSLLTILPFFLSLLMLDALDPRYSNASMDLDSALAVAALVLLPLPIAAALILAARALSLLARSRRLPKPVALFELGSRAAGVAAAGAALLVSGSGRWSPEVQAAIVALAYGIAAMLVWNLGLSVAPHRRNLAGRLRGYLTRQGLAWSTGLTTGVLAVLFAVHLGPWSLVLVVALLLLMRQAYVQVVEVSETYGQSVRVIVDAVESHRPDRVGHSQSVADIAAAIGDRLGMSDDELRDLRYAALLHDVGRDVGVASSSRSSAVSRDAAFLDAVHPCLQILDGRCRNMASASERQLASAYIVAVASDLEESDSGRVDAVSMAPRLASEIPAAIRGRVVGAVVALGYTLPPLA